ncbi:conserved hypothetical protein [Marinobacter salarius]|nr:conserved hypothetical protein [Marinobacter salarius]VXC46056.1 conserved hypothetical protein [Marinobacter salarius]
MDQITFSETEYQTKKQKSRCKNFSGANGQIDSLEAVREESSSLLPQGPERTTSVPVVCDAASPLHAVAL